VETARARQSVLPEINDEPDHQSLDFFGHI